MSRHIRALACRLPFYPIQWGVAMYFCTASWRRCSRHVLRVCVCVLYIYILLLLKTDRLNCRVQKPVCSPCDHHPLAPPCVHTDTQCVGRCCWSAASVDLLRCHCGGRRRWRRRRGGPGRVNQGQRPSDGNDLYAAALARSTASDRERRWPALTFLTAPARTYNFRARHLLFELPRPLWLSSPPPFPTHTRTHAHTTRVVLIVSDWIIAILLSLFFILLNNSLHTLCPAPSQIKKIKTTQLTIINWIIWLWLVKWFIILDYDFNPISSGHNNGPLSQLKETLL